MFKLSQRQGSNLINACARSELNRIWKTAERFKGGVEKNLREEVLS